MATSTRAPRRPRPANEDGPPVVPLPTFTPPDPAATPPEPPTDLGEEKTTGTPLNGGGGGLPYGGVGSPDTIRTRTDTSSDNLSSGGPHRAETARNAGILLAGLLTIAAGAAAVMMARVGRELRRPTREETRDVARPVARILLRHIPADMVTADLADLGEAGAAVSNYVTAGPVAPRVYPVQHIGMPDVDGVDLADDAAPTTPAAPTAAEIWHQATNDNVYPSALTTDDGPKPEVRYHQ